MDPTLIRSIPQSKPTPKKTHQSSRIEDKQIALPTVGLF
jgi:hypothetical protein